MSWFTETKRAYIYRALIALGALLAGYGLVSQNDLVLWLGLAATLLNVMPAANTHTRVSDGENS